MKSAIQAYDKINQHQILIHGSIAGFKVFNISTLKSNSETLAFSYLATDIMFGPVEVMK